MHWPGLGDDASQSPLCNTDEGSQGGPAGAWPRLHMELCQNQAPQRGEFGAHREAVFFFYQVVQVLETRDQEWGGREGLRGKKTEEEKGTGIGWERRDRRGAAGVRSALT